MATTKCNGAFSVLKWMCEFASDACMTRTVEFHYQQRHVVIESRIIMQHGRLIPRIRVRLDPYCDRSMCTVEHIRELRTHLERPIERLVQRELLLERVRSLFRVVVVFAIALSFIFSTGAWMRH